MSVPSTRKTRIAVLFGGRSAEHDVSCRSAAGVLAHLDRAAYEVVPVRITADGAWRVGPDDPAAADRLGDGLADALAVLAGVDVAFPCLHGRHGEDGTVQGLLDLAGVPYVGSGVAASALGMDKALTKTVLAAAGMAVADGVVLTGPGDTVGPADRARLGVPVFVKPARAGSSIGVSRVSRWDDLDAAVARARSWDDKVLVEAALDGPEIDVGVLELPDGTLETGPPLRIGVGSGRAFFDFEAKYADGATVFEVPADIDPALADELTALARRAFRALGCAGLLRVDFVLDRRSGRPVPTVNEVNTMPGLTAASQFPRIWQAAGTGYGRLLDVLVRTALTRRA